MQNRKEFRCARGPSWRSWCALVASAAFVTACADPSAPVAANGSMDASARAEQSAPKFWETNAAANWNELATSLNTRRPSNAARLYAYLSLAQLRAAEDADAVRPHGPVNSAIGNASAAVLRVLFPADAAEISRALAAQKVADPWPGNKHESWSLGATIGSAAAARVLAYAAGDGWGNSDPGLPPFGRGYWIYGRTVARGGFGARPFFLSSASEFRAPPPPAFGSPAFVAALAEVRQISQTRTPEQIAIAQFWHVVQSPTSASVLNNLAVELLRTHRRQELESARLLFLINGSAFDAAIGCFDSKFAYWYIRPTQADPSISVVAGVVLPPHPSYPSAHSCITGALTESMALAFPDERRRVEEIATEASLSRLYAGVHYRFDMEAGLVLGRAIARKAADASLSTIAVR